MKRVVALLVLLLSVSATAITISNVTVTGITATSATIAWDTNVATDALIAWGWLGGLRADSGTFDTGKTTHHTYTITTLRPQYSIKFLLRSCTGGVCQFYKSDANGQNFQTSAAASGGALAAYIVYNGGHHVYQGSTMIFGLEQAVTAGTSNYNGNSTLTLSNLPPHTVAHWPDQEWGGIGWPLSWTTTTLNFYAPQPTQVMLYTNVGGTTPPGTYTTPTATLTFGGSAYTVSTTFTIVVDPPASFTISHPSGSQPAIPNLAKWQTDRVYYGQKYCTSGNIFYDAGGASVLFYDGERNYRQLKAWDTANNITGNPSQWDTCISLTHTAYTNLIQSSPVWGYWNFSTGLTMGGDLTNGALLTNSKALNHRMWANIDMPFDMGTMREMSYQLEGWLNDSTMDHTQQIAQSVDYLLGYVSMIVAGDPGYGVYEPFMGSLLAEALRSYYDTNPSDVRPLIAIQQLADWTWANAWDSFQQSHAFAYQIYEMQVGLNQGHPETNELRGLNLLIAPWYAYVWHMTNDSTYRDQGDAIWSGFFEVDDDALNWGYGKDYSQSFKWSEDFVTYRTGSASQQQATAMQGVKISGATVR